MDAAARKLAVTAAAEVRGRGWQKLTLSAILPEDGIRVIVQLLDQKGSNGFEADGQFVEISSVQLEAGQSASEYRMAASSVSGK